MALSSPPAHAPSTLRRLAAPERRAAALEFPSWPLTLLAVPIVLRAALFVGALVVEPWPSDPERIIPAWAQVLQAACFGALAFVLLRYGRQDRRAWSLGLFTLDVAATLLTPFVRSVAQPSLATQVALHLRTDAFQAALVWYFAGLFPRSSTSVRLARLFYTGTALAFVLGVSLVALDMVASLRPPVVPDALMRLAVLAQRESPRNADWYFTLQFLSLLPLLAGMPLKLRECGPDARRRFMWLAAGIALGLLPLVADTLLVTLWPWYANPAEPPMLPLRGALIVLFLTVVPIAGAYAALVQRTLDIRLILRQAFQHLLARSFVTGLALAPFASLGLLVAANRDRAVGELVAGPLGLAFAALTTVGAAAAFGRRRLLAAIDRRFFCEQIDARSTLLSVSEGARSATSLENLVETLSAAATSAFHPESVVTAVVGSDDCLHSIDADLPPLRQASALAQLLGGTDAALDLTGADAAFVQRLGEHERAWLGAARPSVLVPLRGARGHLLGMLVLGEKQSELPYSRDDCALLSAVGASGGVALSRLFAAAGDEHRSGASGLLDPPARECVECGTVFGPEVEACGCGGALQRAPAPLTLGDRLRFLRRVGAGGMGVVYRTLDLRLQQPRAVKTLPTADPAMMARLRREAKHMAAATHPNLATLHGLELWRGSPMLVMEFLEGGTLSDRLHRGPLSSAEMLVLGSALAQGLAALHATGLLHRDIKPSNIGFAANGTPKLLDFGLARLAPASTISTSMGRDADESTRSVSLPSGGVGIRGTPAYLSPEVLGGAAPCAEDDLWSLSVSLLEASTGANPFKAQSVAATVARVLTEAPYAAQAAAQLPAPVFRLFKTLLGPRDARPKSALQFSQRLTECTLNGG